LRNSLLSETEILRGLEEGALTAWGKSWDPSYGVCEENGHKRHLWNGRRHGWAEKFNQPRIEGSEGCSGQQHHLPWDLKTINTCSSGILGPPGHSMWEGDSPEKQLWNRRGVVMYPWRSLSSHELGKKAWWLVAPPSLAKASSIALRITAET
jgi:hypothetical protein